MRRSSIAGVGAAASCALLLPLLLPVLSARTAVAAAEDTRPNLVWILADDLGYGEVGCFGQKLIATPRLDRMAAEGLRFTQLYAGSTVCAPSRAVLMTGQHVGRTWVRGNGDPPSQTLREEDVTVAEVLRRAGYRTALIGKWGLGEVGTTGHPLRKGFGYFFGYLNQVHAHNSWPEFLWQGEDRVPLRNEVVPVGQAYAGFVGGYATKRVDWSHQYLIEDALRWLASQGDKPFFLYLAPTIPHANNEGKRATGNGQEVPDQGAYATRDWPEPDRCHAAMISRLDRDVGRILDLLEKLGLAKRTLVVFSSDNGHQSEGGQSPERFDSNGPLRGKKRDLYEGGIRVPTIAWWPGTIAAGTVSDHVGYFGDLMATAAEMAGANPPAGTDGVSFLPTLRGDPAKQAKHPYLYWEFYEGAGGAQAVRAGRWKAVRKPAFDGPIELYDLEADVGEERDVAAEHPDEVKAMERRMAEAHVPSPHWRVPG